MFFSVHYILFVELLERFCFYGINYTQTAYLTGVYDDEWNANLTAVEASSLVAMCIALAYTSPFLGATLADKTALGEYGTIVVGCACFYLPGLILLWYTTIPQQQNDTDNNDGTTTDQNNNDYPTTALLMAILCLWPMGTGMVKSVVNVFGAKQFHPIVQSSLIESYYVNFYMCINVGALLGGILIPIVAQFSVQVAYAIPVFVLSLGIGIFVLGTNRYVVTKKKKKEPTTTPNSSSSCCPPQWMTQLFCSNNNNNNKKKMILQYTTTAAAAANDTTNNNNLSIASVAKVCMLLIPFNIAYSQMSTTFIIQGSVMRKEFGVVDAASMNNADTLSVLFFGYWIGNHLYPFLSRRDIKLPTTHKFALGSFMSVCALSWALWVEYQIHATYENKEGESISVLWQIPSYTFIGIGEIFAVSSAYEVAFTIAPTSMKGLASAVNLFFIGGLPNVFCLFLYQQCQSWFENDAGRATLHTLSEYTQAHVYYYFGLLWCIAVSGVGLNLLPPVRMWVQGLEEAAAASIQTPKMTPNTNMNTLNRRRQMRKQQQQGNSSSDEQSPLLLSTTTAVQMKSQKQQEHENYFEYGSGPLLHKSGSMRAGPTLLSQTTDTTRHEQQIYNKIQLYQSQKQKKKQQQNQKQRLILPPMHHQKQQQQQTKQTILSKEAPY